MTAQRVPDCAGPATPTTGPRARALLIVAIPLLLGIGACRDCDTDEEVYLAVRQAMLYPETFQQYVADNQSLLGQGYLDCSSDCASRLTRFIEAEMDNCDAEIDPDWRNACYDDLSPWIILRNDVLELRQIIATSTAFNTTSLHDVLVAQKAPDPAAYVNYNSQMIDVAKPYLVCRKCHRTFLGIDF